MPDQPPVDKSTVTVRNETAPPAQATPKLIRAHHTIAGRQHARVKQVAKILHFHRKMQGGQRIGS